MRNTTGPIAILSRQPAILNASVSPDLWQKKVVGFAIGLAAALVLNLLVGPESAVWRSLAISHPAEPATSSLALAKSVPTASAPSVAPVGLAAKPAPVAPEPAAVAVKPAPVAMEPASVEGKPAAAATEPAAVATELAAVEAKPDSARVAEHPSRKSGAHKVRRASKRHAPKRRAASRY